MEEYQQLFIRNPAERYEWAVYTLPFSKEAWFGVLAFVLVIPFLMAITMFDCKYKISIDYARCIFFFKNDLELS